MITINIEPNTITPFVDSDQAQINFKVESNYYIPYTTLYNPNNTKKPLQITTRTSQIDFVSQDRYTYGFSLKLSPEINEITQPSSKYFSNFREQENFNSYVSNFKEPVVFEWEERRFTDFPDVMLSTDQTIQLNTDNKWSNIYKQNYLIIQNLFSNKPFEKRTSIHNLKMPNIRGINEDFKMMFPNNHMSGPFNEVFNGYCLPVIYNNQHQFWENTSTLKLLNNYWEKILLNLDDQERYSFISKILYPIITNTDLHNFYFGGYLEPFTIRDILEYKVRPKNILNGLKLSLVDAGISAKGITNIVTDYININGINDPKNAFLESNESFSDIQTISLQEYSYDSIRRNANTNSVFDLNGNITNQKSIVVSVLDNPYPLWNESINFHYLNEDEHYDPIIPFNDSNKSTDTYLNRYNNFYPTDLPDYENIVQTLSSNLFDRKGILVIEDQIQYTSKGYDIDKSNNPIGRDSKIYVGLKE
jgi:hypothetical protein